MHVIKTSGMTSGPVDSRNSKSSFIGVLCSPVADVPAPPDKGAVA
jgi:hypothetical protein